MKRTLGGPAVALLCLAAASAAPPFAAAGDFHLESRIAFASERDNLDLAQLDRFEVYLMNPNGTDVRRLTYNTAGDGFPVLSPDGKKIVFDSNRNRPPDGSLPCPVAPGGTDDPSHFVSDLFLMNADGSDQALLARGSSATWSADSKNIAFHASASDVGCPSRSDPGAAATDSDIVVANVDDLLAGVEQPRNITNTPDKIDDDADWSSTGRIVYTAHEVGDDITNPQNPQGAVSNSSELYVVDPDGSDRLRLTDNAYEDRTPSWSPDGNKIVYSCRIGGGFTDFEICLIDAHKNPDGTLPTPTVLTNNSFQDLTPSFSPDGQRISFQQRNQVVTMRAALNPDGTLPAVTQLTFAPGLNLFPNWGELRVKDPKPAHTRTVHR